MQIFEQKPLPDGQPPACAGVSPLLARLLYARGATDAAAMEAFLHPSVSDLHDPYRLRDMDKAVTCLQKAVAAQESICLFGDYDVDGICAVSMLYLYLRSLGARVRYFIPSRHAEGYGMRMEAVERLAQEGVSLIVTVDNGVKANAEAERCYALGMRLIVTDHHLCGETLPRAEAVVCHTRPDDDYPNKNICGAGTAYKLIQALAGNEAALAYLPLAGIATVADVVPLLGENRAFVALALERLNCGACAPGLLALGNLLRRERAYTAWDIAFGFAPRLNAAGRMAEASLGVELLCGEDPQLCAQQAGRLEELNAQRRQEEMRICNEACAAVEADDLTEKRAIVLRGKWNSGVIGIAASRVAERYYRPTILFAEGEDGMLTGSARSIPGVHLYAALLQCAALLVRFGGHAYAAGLTLSAARYDDFCAAFEEAVRFVAPETAFLPRRFYEMEMPLSEVSEGFAKEIERLAPFGEGNPYPLLCTRGAYLRGLKRMGDGSHLRGTLTAGESGAACTLFGMGAELETLLAMDRCDALYIPAVNVWNGMHTLQLQIKAVRPGLPDKETYLRAHGAKFVDAFSRNILYNTMCDTVACTQVEPDAWLEAALGAQITGVLALCFTEAGAMRLLSNEAACAKLSIGFYREMDGPCAYHAAVLAPMLARMTPWRYRQILVYDTPVTAGVLQALARLAPKAQFFVGRGDPKPLTDALRFTRETLSPLYRAFREAARPFYTREELVTYLAARTGTPDYRCRLAVDIMAELGFAEESGGIRFVPDAKYRPLEESETYRTLHALCIE